MNKDIKLLVESFFDDMFDEHDEEQNDNSLLSTELLDNDEENQNELTRLICGVDNIDYCTCKEEFIDYIINICAIEQILKYIYHNTTHDGINIFLLMDNLVFPKNDITYEKYLMNTLYGSKKHSPYRDSFKMYNKKYDTRVGDVQLRGKSNCTLQIDLYRIGTVYLDCTIPIKGISEREYIRKNVEQLKTTLSHNQGSCVRFFNHFDTYYKLLHNEFKTSLKIEEKHIETIKKLIEKRRNKYKFNWRADVINFSELYEEINNNEEFIPYLVAYMVIYKQYVMKEAFRDNPINITYDDIMSIVMLNMLDIRIVNDGSTKYTIYKYELDIPIIINTYNKYYNDKRLSDATKEILKDN